MRRRATCYPPLLILTIAILTGLCSSLSAQQFPVKPTGVMGPSELHEIMATGKAEALERSRAAAALAVDQAASTQTNYDVGFYDVQIRVNDTTEVLYGSVRMIAEAAEPGVNLIQIDLMYNMPIDSIIAPSGALSYARVGNVVHVTLDDTYNPGTPFECTTYYHGHPLEGGFLAFSFGSHLGKPSIASLSEPYYARTWWPCKDRMDDKADSFYIAIEVDTSLYVGSNGLLDSVVAASANSQIYHYSTRYPMVTYLFSIAVHPYTVWTDEYVYNGGADTMPVVHAVYPDKYAESVTGYDHTPEILGVLASNFGEYPFVKEKYGHANFEWGGGMEHQTMTSMWGDWFGFYEPTVIHEAAHQWWGDMITCESWSDIWLNEGWASYAEAVYYLDEGGWASYHNYMSGMAYTGGGTIYVYDTSSVSMIFHGGRSYDKGAWVCHMLRGVLGDSLFFEGVDAYYSSEYKYGAATTEDFKNVFENATATELDYFFNEWIFGTYFPQYRFEFMSRWVDFGTVENYVFVEQLQTSDPQVFTMPVDFFLDYQSGTDDTAIFMVDQRQQLFKWQTTTTLANVKLDPSAWILKSAVSQPWQLHIVTFNDELPQPTLHEEYMGRIVAYGASATYTVTITSGSLPPGLGISDAGLITGIPTDTGTYTFTVNFDDIPSDREDSGEFTLVVSPKLYVPGDVNLLDGLVDIADLTMLISYLFIDYVEPPNMDVADVNADCSVDIGDVTDMISYLFLEGPDLLVGCAAE